MSYVFDQLDRILCELESGVRWCTLSSTVLCDERVRRLVCSRRQRYVSFFFEPSKGHKKRENDDEKEKEDEEEKQLFGSHVAEVLESLWTSALRLSFLSWETNDEESIWTPRLENALILLLRRGCLERLELVCTKLSEAVRCALNDSAMTKSLKFLLLNVRNPPSHVAHIENVQFLYHYYDDKQLVLSDEDVVNHFTHLNVASGDIFLKRMDAEKCRLKHLDFADCTFSLLVSFLRRYTKLESLQMMGLSGTERIFEALSGHSLKHVQFFRSDELVDSVTQAFCQFLSSTMVESVHADWLNSAVCQALCVTKSVTTLLLESSRLSSEALVTICKTLPLLKLRMIEIKLTDDDAARGWRAVVDELPVSLTDFQLNAKLRNGDAIRMSVLAVLRLPRVEFVSWNVANCAFQVSDIDAIAKQISRAPKLTSFCMRVEEYEKDLYEAIDHMMNAGSALIDWYVGADDAAEFYNHRNWCCKARATFAVTTMIAARRFRTSVLNVLPKDVAVFLAKSLWETRRDASGWWWKEGDRRFKK